jgi:hypothetical protein
MTRMKRLRAHLTRTSQTVSRKHRSSVSVLYSSLPHIKTAREWPAFINFSLKCFQNLLLFYNLSKHF